MKKHKGYIPRGYEDNVYRTTITWRHYKPTIINLVIYAYIIAMWIYNVKAYYNFGKFIIGPAVSAMFAVGAIVGFIIPAQRTEIAKDVKKFCAGYVSILFVYRIVIKLVSGVSPENFSAAFNQALPQTTSTSILGWLQTILWIAAILGPVKEITSICSRITQFYGTKTKAKTIRQLRDYRDNKRDY